MRSSRTSLKTRYDNSSADCNAVISQLIAHLPFPEKDAKTSVFHYPGTFSRRCARTGMLLGLALLDAFPALGFPYFLKPPILRAGLREPPEASYNLPPAIIRFEPLAIFRSECSPPTRHSQDTSPPFPEALPQNDGAEPSRSPVRSSRRQWRSANHGPACPPQGYLLFIGGRCGGRVSECGKCSGRHRYWPARVPADIVALSPAPLFQDGNDGLAVVFHMRPVADVLPGAVNGRQLSGQRVQDDQGMSFSGNWRGP